MPQGFVRFPEFTEFTEFPFDLGKTPSDYVCSREIDHIGDVHTRILLLPFIRGFSHNVKAKVKAMNSWWKLTII